MMWRDADASRSGSRSPQPSTEPAVGAARRLEQRDGWSSATVGAARRLEQRDGWSSATVGAARHESVGAGWSAKHDVGPRTVVIPRLFTDSIQYEAHGRRQPGSRACCDQAQSGSRPGLRPGSSACCATSATRGRERHRQRALEYADTAHGARIRPGCRVPPPPPVREGVQLTRWRWQRMAAVCPRMMSEGHGE
jgi:hypothetical protein